jgi:PadR family transcriptional regulator PadR
MDEILEWLAAHPGSSGAGISKGTGVGAGSLYPSLAKLEVSGQIMGQWEWPEHRPDGAPRRRLYWITEAKTPPQR